MLKALNTTTSIYDILVINQAYIKPTKYSHQGQTKTLHFRERKLWDNLADLVRRKSCVTWELTFKLPDMWTCKREDELCSMMPSQYKVLLCFTFTAFFFSNCSHIIQSRASSSVNAALYMTQIFPQLPLTSIIKLNMSAAIAPIPKMHQFFMAYDIRIPNTHRAWGVQRLPHLVHVAANVLQYLGHVQNNYMFQIHPVD